MRGLRELEEFRIQSGPGQATSFQFYWLCRPEGRFAACLHHPLGLQGHLWPKRVQAPRLDLVGKIAEQLAFLGR